MKSKKVGMDRGGMLKVTFWEIGFESLCKKGNHLGDEPHMYVELIATNSNIIVN